MSIFNFFKKPKPLKTVVWSVIPGLEEIVPPTPMKDNIPSWFKNMPKDIAPLAMLHPGTAKRCPSFVDYFSQGFVVKMWCDLAVTINEDRSYNVYTPEDCFRFENHGDEQFLDYIPNRKELNISMVLKAFCPWRVLTPPGYSLMQLPLIYNFNKDFTVFPGLIWTDVHHEINQQIAFHGYGDFFIPRGTPLAAYIPFKRERHDLEVSKNTEELSYRDRIAYYWWAGKFKNGYREHQIELKKGERNDS
jgi:hypothetical protein